jgi:hypothetical protein
MASLGELTVVTGKKGKGNVYTRTGYEDTEDEKR